MIKILDGTKETVSFDSSSVFMMFDNDEYEELEADVEMAMLKLGFLRTDAQDILDGKFNRVLRFSATKKKFLEV